MIPLARPRSRALLAFVVVATLAWGCRWMLPALVWTPRTPAVAHSVGILVAILLVGGMTRHLLRREGLAFASLGLTLRRGDLAQGAFGVLVGAGVVVGVALVSAVTLSGSWRVGTAAWGHLLLSLQTFFWGSMLEELIFRGYLLPRLIVRWGRGWALWVLAFAFGLLHLPGLAGMEAVKMVCTTAACGLLFSALVLRTGSLWSAIGAHWAMNGILHTVLGLTGQPALLRPEYATTGPAGIDVGFWTLLLLAAGAAYVLLPGRGGADTAATGAENAASRATALI